MINLTSVFLSLSFVVMFFALILQWMWHKSEFQAKQIKKLEQSLHLVQGLIIAGVRKKDQITAVRTNHFELKTADGKPKIILEIQFEETFSENVNLIGINIPSGSVFETQLLKTIEDLELQNQALSAKIVELTGIASGRNRENDDLRSQLQAQQKQSAFSNQNIEKETLNGNEATGFGESLSTLPPPIQKPEIVSAPPVVRNKYADRLRQAVEEGKLRLASKKFPNMDFLKEAARKQEQMRLNRKSLQERFGAKPKNEKISYGKHRQNN